MILKRLSLTFFHPIQVGDQKLKDREVLLLTIEKDRHKASAEVSPLKGFSKESLDQVISDLQSIQFKKIEADIEIFLNQKSNYDSFCKNTFLNYDFSQWTQLPSLQWGLCCLFSNYFREKNTYGKIYFQGLLQGTYHEILKKAQELDKNEFSFAKLKVGRIPNEQTLIKDILDNTENLKLRLDANASLSVRDACDLVFDVPRARLDYFEEPVSDVSNLKDYYNNSHIPFAIDENFNSFAHFSSHASAAGFHALILKPTLIGDYHKIEKMISLAQNIQPDVKLIVSSSYESQLGLKNLCRLAQVIAPHEHHGLDTWNIFLEQVCHLDVKQNTISFDENDSIGVFNVC